MTIQISKANQEYIEARNTLVPIAEAIANRKTKKKGEWNKVFFKKMDSLAKLIPIAQAMATKEIKANLNKLTLVKLDLLVKERGLI